MLWARVLDLLSEWLATGRFPREEFGIRPWLALLFGLTILGLGVAYVIHVAD